MHYPALLAVGTVLILGACSSPGASPEQTRPSENELMRSVAVKVALPMQGVANAYEAGTIFTLPACKPAEYPDLKNVYRMSDRFISGSEPSGPEAIARIASWGVKTIVSVDGKTPDAETAAAHGMRYVHIPIQYRGVTKEEQLKILKTFRELEGPFYVHCFHGEHRSAAAVALGRLALDGISREQALAEMRQWAGTSPKYSGLYWDVATADLPDASTTAAFKFGFESTHPLDGMAGAMVQMTRAFEHVRDSDHVGYGMDPENPDIEPLNEALKIEQLMTASMKFEEYSAGADDFRGWMEASLAESHNLVQALRELRAGDATATDRVASTVKALNTSCNTCHTAYRNR